MLVSKDECWIVSYVQQKKTCKNDNDTDSWTMSLQLNNSKNTTFDRFLCRKILLLLLLSLSLLLLLLLLLLSLSILLLLLLLLLFTTTFRNLENIVYLIHKEGGGI